MLVNILSIGILLSGVSYLFALSARNPIWRYILKPGTMVLIIGLAITGLPDSGTVGWLILIGLLFSIAGDIFLMLPSDRFIQGLSSFFIAHVLYVLAFGQLSFTLGVSSWIYATILLVVAVTYYALLFSPVREQGGMKLLIAVGLYILIISWMVWQALLTGQELLIAGALLFYLSDAILAWNRFKKKLVWGDYGVMITYYSAQYLLALSLSFQ
ncbi:lysoplasmalogenase [Hazenella coriacea]|uniref:Putative membrane protein YhhN n=1 Tax=Hazenella coriacea TaxID=1179467 RepID=A0A4R3L4F9_9BACL|nr:lysoplasmalogenase [Hazenella coriacea]TCS93610.1 putative membrane protein YhhN [Hazenella coriacea]